MHHFTYKEGALFAEGVSLETIAETVGTPFYCYSSATLTRHYNVFTDAFSAVDHLICYALKANSNQAVIKTLSEAGAGMDVVSQGELHRALAAGVSADKICFSGVGKTKTEMAAALTANILSFNIESEPELAALNEVAGGLGKVANVAIRINPDVDANTHAKISTGKAENKFGIAYERAREIYRVAAELENIKPTGIHMHIGSQITDLEPFNNAFKLMRELVIDLRADGHEISHIDLGGGLGIPYNSEGDLPPHPEEYAKTIIGAIGDLDATLIFEPGRLIAGNAGILVTTVLYDKKGKSRDFLIVDAAMNDLLRPTLYDAHHEIMPLTEASLEREKKQMDIVGPVCETGDFLAENRMLPAFQPGERLAVMSAGAYGAVLSSTYNSRLLVPEVMVLDDKFAVIRPKSSYEDLIGLDQLPEWLKS